MFIIYTIDVGTPLDLPAVTIPIIISLNEGESKKIICGVTLKNHAEKRSINFISRPDLWTPRLKIYESTPYANELQSVSGL